MPDSKISALSAGSFLLPADEIPVNEAGTTKKLTGAQISRNIIYAQITGDGVADDSIPINAAVTAAPATGATIVVPTTATNVARCAATVLINKPNIALILQGGIILKAANSLNADVLKITASNVLVLDGIIDGNKANNTSGNGITIDCATPSGLVSGVTLFNTAIQSCAGFGVNILATGLAGAVSGVSLIDGTNVTDTNTGVFINGRQASGGTVNLTTIRNCLINTTYQHGVVSTGANRTIVEGSSFLNVGLNKVSGFAHGIAIDGNGGTNPNSYHRILNNYILNPADAGIEVADGITGCEILANQVIGAGHGPAVTNTYGIYFGGALFLSSQAAIIGNTVTSCVGNGIQVTGPDITHLTTGVSILGNSGSGNGATIVMTNTSNIICRLNPLANLVVDGQDFPFGDGAGFNALLTRQAGANADALFRNTGTGNIILRPNDASANDVLIGIANVVIPKGLRRSRQTPTEAVLVSGVDATAGENVEVTLTAARVVGAPLNPAIGQHLIFTLIQGGAGAFAVTWNATFKKVWSDAGNATGARSSIEFHYNGTNWNQVAGQATYV